jgi:XTP/dITP diphosphohydrolase
MTGRLVVVAASVRVAPGLLSWRAWSTLCEADEVYSAHPDDPVARARQADLAAELATAGVDLLVRPPGETAGQRAAFLEERAAGRSVVWLSDEGTSDTSDTGDTRDMSDTSGMSGAETVAGSWDLPGAHVLDLVAVMDRLRSPGGCPWDAEQTHGSLLPYLLEEAYETVEVIENGDTDGLREELGDLLLQVVFHARLAQEQAERPWSIDAVADQIAAKLVRRHPHVFATPDGAVVTADDVERNWERLKRVEKGRTSVVDGVPLAQPALALAAKLVDRAARAGLPTPPVAPTTELLTEGPLTEEPLTEEVLGASLLRIVVRARAAGLDAEGALRAAARRYVRELHAAEARAGSFSA